MLKIKSYVKVKSVAEAYELNQKKTAIVLGGMVWLKMGNRNISTAIDLSGLGLDTIQEFDDEFVIGCMTPLRELEINESLNEYTHGAIQESLRHIVGVQFRNCATVGGSIWGRYGFSDVLTMFLGMDTWVELYDAGKIPLTEFLKNIPDDVKNTQLFANVQKLSNYDLNYEDVWWLVDSYGLIDKEDAEEELMEYYEQENKLHCYIKSIISNPSISEREKLVILLSHIEPLIYNTLNYTKQPYSKVKQIVQRMSIDENEGMSSESVGKLYVMGITYVVFANTDAYTKEIDKRIPFRNNILHNGIVEYGTDDIHSAYELLVEFISMLVFIKKQLINEKTK